MRAGSILSQTACENRLPESTGRAEVTGGLNAGGERTGARSTLRIEIGKLKLEKGEEKNPREVNSRKLKVEK
jgi:hypothetical protein